MDGADNNRSGDRDPGRFRPRADRGGGRLGVRQRSGGILIGPGGTGKTTTLGGIAAVARAEGIRFVPWP